MTLRPLKQRLCVRAEPSAITPGGIHIPGTHAHETNRARVVAAGPDATCKAGDQVIVSNWAHVELDDETCHRHGEAPGLRFLHEDSVCMRNDGSGWQPLKGRVLIKLDAKASLFDKLEDKREGIVQVTGFIGLGEDERLVAAQPTEGEVVLASDGCDVKPGERVLTGKYNGCQLEPETCIELGFASDALLFCVRETHQQEIGTMRGRKVYAPADEIHGVLEAGASEVRTTLRARHEKRRRERQPWSAEREAERDKLVREAWQAVHEHCKRAAEGE